MLYNDVESFQLAKLLTGKRRYLVAAIAVAVLAGAGYLAYQRFMSKGMANRVNSPVLDDSDSTSARLAPQAKLDERLVVVRPIPDNRGINLAAEVHDKVYMCVRGACVVKEGAPDTLWLSGRIVRIGRKPDTIELSLVLWNRVKILTNVQLIAPDSVYDTKWKGIKLNTPGGQRSIFLGSVSKDEYQPFNERLKFTLTADSLVPPKPDSTICLYLKVGVSAAELGEPVLKPLSLFAKVQRWTTRVDSRIERHVNKDSRSAIGGEL